ncbi:MAG: ATP-binding protein [Fibrobacteria bacterium]|nr:ATP-binding protein [Fibrobacteria bacterium]
MYRLAKKYLLEWQSKPGRKPLIIRGARQVGKSWLVKDYAKTFEKFFELNFEENSDYIGLFGHNLDPVQLVKNINNYFGDKIVPGQTLLFLDEIQLCPQAIKALRFFYEKMPELHIIAAGSLLEFELEKISFPVGRVEFMYLKPLSFFEFLIALGQKEIAGTILDMNGQPVNDAVHKKLLRLFRDYTIVGGMPEVVGMYISEGENFRVAQQVLIQLIDTYKADFKKYAKEREIKHLELLFSLLPLQLGNKIKYTNISRDIRSNDLSAAIDLLEKAGLIYRIYHSNSNGIPLGAETNPKKFKIILLDVGVANFLSGLDVKQFIMNENVQLINNGTIAESVVGQELLAYPDYYKKKDLHYWHREDGKSNAEVDYVIAMEGSIVPVEVKDGERGRMRSIYSFLDRKQSSYGLRISKNNFSFFDKIKSIPFYAVMTIHSEEIKSAIESGMHE